MEGRLNHTPFTATIGWPQPPHLFFFFVVLFFCKVQPFGTLFVQAQSQEGFISVDCGFEGGSRYQDNSTGLEYSPDSQFINTGENRNVSENRFSKRYGTLRSFPNGTRNCYRLSPVQSGNKYLIRAGFLYGNYDGQGSSPIFDLHIGVNFWTTVKMGSAGRFVSDIITVSQGDLIQVCLVNTGTGTPFISVLELRPLLNFMYPFANASQSLVNQERWNYGTGNQVRYPDDPYDRIWDAVTNDFLVLNTTNEVEVKAGDVFLVPSKVLRTAVSDTRPNLDMTIRAVSQSPGARIYIVMHFAELVKLNSANESRQLNIFGLNGQVLLFPNYIAPYLTADHKEIMNVALGGSGSYNISINVSSSSTHSYMINALESFIVRQMNESQTDDRDVSAIEDIKRVFRLTGNWEADPCSPKEYTWKGVSCSGYGDSRPARIISLNLSSTGLDGKIPTSIGNLTALASLDLSNNYLIGPIPDILGELPYLQFINLSGNEDIGVVPENICQKMLEGILSLSINGEPKQCKSGHNNNNKQKIIIPIIIVVIILLMMLLVVFVWLIKRKRKKYSSQGFSNEQCITRSRTTEENSWKRKSVQFTYAEILQITQKFNHEIGKGGFGIVYLGNLTDGTKVAVKVLSSSSSQGSKEFQSEVLLLSRVHHKNLVCLLGYCEDIQHLSLVYEYMDNGTLRDHLSGDIHNSKLLSWSKRVNIALQAAQGLDYLHNGCRPPIIHRDIKSNNILLNCELVAKIADFGLSRAFSNDYATHITTGLAGTLGYLDPECLNSKLSQKSDVYSFGIVLLEIITGQPPHSNSTKRTHIVEWVHSKFQSGDIKNIIDPMLKEDIDINIARKIIEVAISCTSKTSEERMTMSNTVIHLKQCLEVIESHKSSMQKSNGTLDFESSAPTAPSDR
ncbi:unnamed protein product [Spirodela intermedia]|uniref:non-specific serine/threonine protein kinase n=1 Tax=Spirodela intermedia TaxID=51605 RepID=A0A7I8L4N7_SPIIN|nr:unnamed protein product [Spirodela intermedia]